MKSEKNILIAFILNLVFSIFEMIGGFFTGSIAIISDSVHDIGDAASIGISYFLEKKSKKQPDGKYTFGYMRYSVMGSVITTLILLVGSIAVIAGAVERIINPSPINYDGMIVFAIVGAAVNFLAAIVTRDGHSLNQRAVNLHMLEDVLGWIVVLVGAVVMRFTDFYIIDPIMSIGVAAFIFVNAVRTLLEILNVLLVKIPDNVDVEDIKERVCAIEGVEGAHHIHVWSMDGEHNYATLHIVTAAHSVRVKAEVKAALAKLGIAHVTLEIEQPGEECGEQDCHVDFSEQHGHHHHHHGKKHEHCHEHE
ncbi:MAG: cation transporter, partial [Clostridia bacterium]|nr:cation transporter [Clostridia bacterium]